MSAPPPPLRLLPLGGLPAIEAGADLPALLADALDRAGVREPSGALVVCQKIVSKAEGRVVALGDVEPSEPALRIAREDSKDARVVELVLRESARIVRRGHGVLITETHHGFVCANAGVDLSNVPGGERAVLLPLDPDASASALREGLARAGFGRPAVIVSDSFGRPFREGLVDVAIGCAGLAPLEDLRGQEDWSGRPLEVTVNATADQAAAAAGLLMQKGAGIPAVWIEGLRVSGEGSCKALVRDPSLDLFR